MASHPLRMRMALGSNPSVSTAWVLEEGTGRLSGNANMWERSSADGAARRPLTMAASSDLLSARHTALLVTNVATISTRRVVGRGVYCDFPPALFVDSVVRG